MDDNTARAIVVHAVPPFGATKNADTPRDPKAQLSEIVGLAEAISLNIVAARLIYMKQILPAMYLGRGHAESLRAEAEEFEAEVIIVNTTLSPTQQRNLEKATNVKIIDRTALILEIFGARARTAEGKLQVELAALSYQKSRLVRSWTHLERQRGGRGFMGGPGEKQIETDRRMLSDRIIAIKRQLENVVRTRELGRKQRRDAPYPTVALVGYTNAGKSTLFNSLTGATVLAQDQLFATLDPTVRAMELPGGMTVMLSDTVGFISNLPHELVAAFRATLEEVLEADLLIHVRDLSHSDHTAQAADVALVLKELFGKAPLPPMIEAWNKMDLLDEMPQATANTVPISAISGKGIARLLAAIEESLTDLLLVEKEYRLPVGDGRARAWLHSHGTVRAERSDDDYVIFTVQLSSADIGRFERLFLSSV